ncbi:hypothetical protein DFH07DRAFT_766931 [Mycena maculata]|uniref:Uncharacterized protein n=1 Tax=Mycena maculata TaxID=230809 RepID=A0AAD7NUR8_9AGAR|nr:hypothetical protein DFH07DRAFT_766931 [Mycena maculata]
MSQAQLDALNTRCISLLNALEDAYMKKSEHGGLVGSLDESVIGFLDEMDLILRGIRERLAGRRSLNFVSSAQKHGEIQTWILQNQRIEDAFRAMNARVLICHAKLLSEMRAMQERDHEDIRTCIAELQLRHLDNNADRAGTPAPKLPPIFGADPPSFLPSASHFFPVAASGSRSECPDETPKLSICKQANGKICYGNVEGIIDYMIQTDDPHTNQLVLGTYQDFATPNNMFQIFKQRLEDIPREIRPHRRPKILKLMVALLRTVEDSTLLPQVREFVSTSEVGLTPEDRTMIIRAIELLLSVVEPIEPHDIAITLTFIERDIHKSSV